MGSGTTFRKIKPPSEGMIEHYASLFVRNQSKFMRRSLLKPEHLGSEFVLEGIGYKVIGSATPFEMVIETLEDKTYYMVHSDIITPLILGT